MTPTETDKAYLAGLIDGEGTVCIFASSGVTNGKRYDRGRPILAIVNTHEGVLQWVADKFGRNSRRVYRKPRSPVEKQAFVWETGWQHAREVLESCLPYLIIKRRQAELFIEYTKTCKKWGRACIPDDIKTRRAEIITEISNLNKRGPRDAVVPIGCSRPYEQSQHSKTAAGMV